MRVYFNASLVGKEKYSEEYKTTIEIVKKLGHKSFTYQVMERDYREVSKQTRRKHEEDFRKARSRIERSDVMIVEATYPSSIGVGHTMTIALDMYKPILVLYQAASPHGPHGLLIGDPNRLLTVRKYSLKDIKKLEKTIKIFLQRAEKKLLKKRFNFMLDKTQEDYLGWISKKQNISKANFIRMLIDKSIDKDKEYT